MPTSLRSNEVRDWGVFRIHEGDCAQVLRQYADNTFDSVVCDPPYGLAFMGKRWDYDVPSIEAWAECLRVLKPGGHLLAFAGTRTQHRMAVRIEDAGFEIRDLIAWVYGSGFPKSMNLGGDRQGWGTALKPAMEPITVGRKPLIGTVADNVLAHGTGAINVDGCRIPTTDVLSVPQSDPHKRGAGAGEYCVSTRDTDAMHAAQRASIQRTMELGRWPANLIHDGSDEVLAAFPQAPGQQGDLKGHSRTRQSPNGIFGAMAAAADHTARNDTGSAARFFYCAKASKSDRGADNAHPTVKPTDLMRYLCRLITPPGGHVLDPFCGSGSTGKAAVLEGFRFTGVDLSPDYCDLAVRRIAAALYGGLAA